MANSKYKGVSRYWGLSVAILIVITQQIHNPWQRTIIVSLLSIILLLLVEKVTRDHCKLLGVANRDELTGLGNFRAFQDRIRLEVSYSNQNNTPFAMLLIDLDYFKKYNDTFGHRKGNDLLQTFGQIMLANVRSTDGVFRFGGDEFAIILPLATLEDARQIVLRIRENFSSLGIRGSVTLSIGLSQYFSGAETAEQFFDRVDSLLYNVKMQGGNGFQLPPVGTITPSFKQKTALRT